MHAYRGTLVRAARTLAVAVVVCAGVGGAALALQAAVLGKPPRSALVAADILGRLDEFRLVDSTGSIAGHPFRGVCYQGWFVVGRGRKVWKQLGAGLLLGDGTRIVETGASILVPRPRRRLARLELRLGCPRVLDAAIAYRLVRGSGLQLGRQDADYRLRFRTRRQEVAYLAASPTLAPLGVDIHAGSIFGRCSFRDGGLTPRKLVWLRRELRARLGRRWAEPA